MNTVLFFTDLETLMEVKHEHIRYVIGRQPRRDTIIVQKSKFGPCPEIMEDEEVAPVGYFYRVAGTKKFCTYVLVYNHTTAASNPKVKIPRVMTLAKNIIPYNSYLFLNEKDLTKFVGEPFVPAKKIVELDQTVNSIVSSASQITSTSKVSEDEITIPLKNLKNGQVLWRSLEVHLILLSKKFILWRMKLPKTELYTKG